MDINKIFNESIVYNQQQKNVKKTLDLTKSNEPEESTSKIQYFRDLCKKYTNVAFVVISDSEGTVCDSFASQGASDISQFGTPGKVSFLIPEKVVEKMAEDSEYEKRVYSQIDTLIYNYGSITNGLTDETMTSVAVQLEDLDGVDKNHLGFKIRTSEGNMNYYINAGKQNFVLHQEMLKKINYLNEIKYNKMLDQLFQTSSEKKL